MGTLPIAAPRVEQPTRLHLGDVLLGRVVPAAEAGERPGDHAPDARVDTARDVDETTAHRREACASAAFVEAMEHYITRTLNEGLFSP
jgi:hypothetical protein